MKIKFDFITNSSSVNYTLADTDPDRKELKVKIEGFEFDLFKEFPSMYKIKKMCDLEEVHGTNKNSKAYVLYKELLKSGKAVYEIWTDGQGSLMDSYLYHNKINNLPDGVENVDIYLGG
jgi:hypothetical protein